MAQILGTGKQRAGKGSRIGINNVAQVLGRWSAESTKEEHDTTSFESGGFSEAIVGIDQANVTLAGDWDAGANFYDDPPGIYPRDDLAAVKFFTSISDNIFWDFTYLFIRSASNSAEVRGKIAFEASGRNQGSYFLPAGSV